MEPIVFGVRVVTYRRPDGRTPEFLSKTLNSVLAQKYRHWKVFLVGDRYEDEAEFKALASLVPPGRIYATNRRGRTERDVWRDYNLWMCCGCTAVNYALDLMQACGVDYLANLDHDDIWGDDHLQTLADCYAEHPEAAFACTQGYNTHFGVIPRDVHEFRYVDGAWLNSNVNHSATSWRLSVVPLRYRAMPELVPWCPVVGDIDMWLRMGDYLRDGPWKMACIPKVTVWHEEHLIR